MRKVYQQMFGSFLSIAILAMVIVIPFWIAEKLENVETSEEGIVPTQSIVSSSDTTSSYQPYSDFQNDRLLTDFTAGEESNTLCLYNPLLNLDPYITFDANGNDHLIGYSLPAGNGLYIFIEASASQFLIDGIELLYITFNSTEIDDQYSLTQILFFNANSDREMVGGQSTTVTIPGDLTGLRSGKTEYELALDTTTLNSASAKEGSYPYHGMRITLTLDDNIPVSYFNVEFEPEYFQVNTTTYDNSTITTYEPYILTFSNPYTWTKVLLWFDGILLVGVAVVITPFFNFSMFKLNMNRRKRK